MPLAMEANILSNKWWDLVGESGTHLAHLANCTFGPKCVPLCCAKEIEATIQFELTKY